jgi:hypothetical protein
LEHVFVQYLGGVLWRFEMRKQPLKTQIDLHQFKEIPSDVFLQAMSGKFAKAAEDAKRHTASWSHEADVFSGHIMPYGGFHKWG